MLSAAERKGVLMKIEFVKPEVRVGKEYKGEIVRYKLDERHKAFRVYVILDKEPKIEFMKRIDIDWEVNSAFAVFCCEMGIYSEDDNSAELEELIGTRVIAVLNKGEDEKLYIGDIQLDEAYYQEQDEEV